jgi:hypothetical protein
MKKIPLLILLCCLPFMRAFAQENDFGMWNTLDVEYEITPKFSAVATEEFRLKENLTRVNLLYTNLGVSFKPNKHLKISPVYRFIQKAFNDGSFGIKHRLMLDVAYKTKFSFIAFTARTRLQAEVAYPGADALGDVFEYYWRQKFDFKFDIGSPHFTPYVGTELRIQFFTPHIKEFQDFGFSRTRVYAGCNYEINKRNEVGAYFLVQNDFQVNDPSTLYILGLEYSITLGGDKKKNNDAGGE